MSFTVWCAGQLLGTSTLDMPSGGAGSRTGFLKPSDAFPEIWTRIGPVCRELREVMHALVSDPGSLTAMGSDTALTAEENARRIREALLAHPLTDRMTAALAGVDAMQLEVRDADGQAIQCTRVVVQEMTVPEFVTPELVAQAIVEAGMVEDGPAWPMYIVSVVDLPTFLARAKGEGAN